MDEPLGSRTSDVQFDAHTLADIIERCRAERSARRRNGVDASPGCMELFRRAFAHDQAAWQAVRTTFESLMGAWIGVQHLVEYDDVLQEAFAAFARYAPNHPDLLVGDEIDRLLGFLRRCTKTALLRQLRQARADARLDPQIPAPARDESEIRAAIRDRLASLLETAAERRVFFLRFECDMKPQEIVALHEQEFSDVAVLYDIIQRITRRLRRDTALRELYGLPPIARQKSDSGVSLEIALLSNNEDGAMSGAPCILDEALLLDYIAGAASLEVRQAVEQSPGCVAAARRLVRELRPLLRDAYRLSCPDADTLVSYQEQRLPSSAQLVVHSHVTSCPLCRSEYEHLARIDAVPLALGPGLASRIVEALFQSPHGLAHAVRGTLWQYATPDGWVNIRVRFTPGQPRSFTLRGQVRTVVGRRPEHPPEMVLLQSLDDPVVPELRATIEASGSFVFRELPPGIYSMHVIMEDQEIVIRRIAVGEQET
jgi:hypothetical protein